MFKDIYIETENLIIKPYSMDDLEDLYNVYSDEKVIGWCGLGALDCKPEDVEIFYGLSSEYWGQGLATEAAKAMLNYGFEVIGLNRIIAVVNPNNIASKKVIEKMGMKFKFVLKVDDPNYSGYDGELYYDITKEEWVS